ncbi:MAG: pyridoxal phosphate-dependent aminotransferase [Enterobacteriaceae bacterium]|jgi:alanine-synthesizing transaminase|nr:pyridoxal phosphate-dependent aminotransferase [Enterobacteriaceae bacterium]
MTVPNEWIDLTSFKSGNSQALRLKKELLEAAPTFGSGVAVRLVSDSTGIIVASEENQTEAQGNDPMVNAMLDAAQQSLLEPKTTLTSATFDAAGNKTVEKSRKLDNVCYDIRGPVLKEAKRLEEEGNKVLKLNIGNPAPFGFEAPDEILVDVIRNLPTAQGYCDSKGLYSARKAIMQHYQAQGIRDVTVEDIYIGNGVSELIVQAMQALLNMGDEMLIPAPDYPLWTASVSLSGGNAVHYMCDEESGWFPDLDDIRKKITPRTRGIVIINPNNPTGAVYSKELLLEIAQIARENNLIIFADEIYDKILYDDAKHHSIAALAPDLFVITFNGLSKTYRVAGFRQGWMVLSGPKGHAKGYIEGLEMLASMRLCANVPMQHAIQTAIGGYQSINEFIQPGGRLYEQRNRAWELINDIPGVSCVKPNGALYMFPKIDAKRFNIHNDQKMVLDLLLQQKVLLVQGTGFNWPYPDHFRIVTLPRVDELEMAIGRFAKFLETYKQA